MVSEHRIICLHCFLSRPSSAALTMYQRARKLQDLASDPSLFTSLVDEQLEAYLFAINCLSLLDRKSAWIILPIFSDNGHEVSVNVNSVIFVLSWIKVRKRRRLTRNIPDDKYAEGRHDVEIVDLADIQHDYALLSAQLELLRRDPAMTVMSGELQRMPAFCLNNVNHLGPSVISTPATFNFTTGTMQSLQLGILHRPQPRCRHDRPFRTFDKSMSKALSRSRHCPVSLSLLNNQSYGMFLHLDRQEESSDWLLTDNVSSWPGTSADRGWRYLRQALERHDNAETDYKYTKVAFDTIVAFNGTTRPPLWLVRSLEVSRKWPQHFPHVIQHPPQKGA